MATIYIKLKCLISILNSLQDHKIGARRPMESIHKSKLNIFNENWNTDWKQGE